jgi:Papain family cysteine protease
MFGPVRDQGQRPTCLAFAASDLHAAMRGVWLPLSCEYIFYHAQKRAGRTPKQGAMLPDMLDALRGDGQPAESGWVYLDSLPADLTLYTPPAGVSPLYRRAGESGGNTIKAIIGELDAGRPVLTLLRLSSSFDWVGADGVVDPGPNEAPDYFRRHAVIAVGYGKFKGQPVVLIRNSWGDGWGASGYGWLTENFLLPRVFRLAILKEDLSASVHSHAA